MIEWKYYQSCPRTQNKQGSSEGSPSLRRKLSQVFLSLVNESVVVDRGYKYNGVADHN